MSTAASRFEATMARMDSVLEQRLKREELELEAEAAAREDARRAKMRQRRSPQRDRPALRSAFRFRRDDSRSCG